ncbi:MAG: TPM domain-containing protein [Deltaproteobacteria bacterium]|nr:TPM domain-containing protein [Deltaproteobacteria bacterium]MBN2845116.1 TPM domain-containing protein [Deltaproteobacteria bacterium]
MKSRFLLFFFVLTAVFHISAPLVKGAEILPRPEGAINDFANVISPEQKRPMELLAREVLEKTGTTVVVATIKSIGDNDLTDYANRLYEAWGIGKKGEDKGVLIILAVEERRIRIETGYGVEGILPDGLVGDILDRFVVPQLKQNNYDKGMANALVAVSQVIAKDADVSLTGSPTGSPSRYPARKRQVNPLSLIMLVIVIALLLGTRQGRRMLPFIILMLMMGGRGGGGGFGGFSGGFGGFGGGLSGGGGAGRGF